MCISGQASGTAPGNSAMAHTNSSVMLRPSEARSMFRPMNSPDNRAPKPPLPIIRR
jgi:uncharacterized protein (DUF2342 family)